MHQKNLLHYFETNKYIHYYLDEGMTEFEFVEVDSNINDLISEYCEYNHFWGDSEYYDEFADANNECENTEDDF